MLENPCTCWRVLANEAENYTQNRKQAKAIVKIISIRDGEMMHMSKPKTIQA